MSKWGFIPPRVITCQIQVHQTNRCGFFLPKSFKNTKHSSPLVCTSNGAKKLAIIELFFFLTQYCYLPFLKLPWWLLFFLLKFLFFFGVCTVSVLMDEVFNHPIAISYFLPCNRQIIDGMDLKWTRRLKLLLSSISNDTNNLRKKKLKPQQCFNCWWTISQVKLPFSLFVMVFLVR